MASVLTRLHRFHLSQGCQYLQPSTRSFWGMVDFAFNRVEKKRRKLYGADRSCAEWLLRNGAILKWEGIDSWQLNYNALPDPAESSRYRIEVIDATDSGITGFGFKHLEGLNHVKKVILHKCRVDDDGLNRLNYIRHTLEDLQVSKCPNVSISGLQTLSGLSNLKKLKIFDLNISDDKLAAQIGVLRTELPNCFIDTQPSS